MSSLTDIAKALANHNAYHAYLNDDESAAFDRSTELDRIELAMNVAKLATQGVNPSKFYLHLKGDHLVMWEALKDIILKIQK